MTDLENLLHSYNNKGDIEVELEKIRKKFEELNKIEHLCSCMLICKEMKKLCSELLDKNPESTLYLQIYSTADDQGNNSYLNCTFEINEQDLDNEKVEYIREIIYSNISSRNIQENGLDRLDTTIEINQDNIDSLEDIILSTIADEQYVIMKNNLKMKQNLEEKTHNTVKRKKNSI